MTSDWKCLALADDQYAWPVQEFSSIVQALKQLPQEDTEMDPKEMSKIKESFKNL